jgi:hypothetical protein
MNVSTRPLREIPGGTLDTSSSTARDLCAHCRAEGFARCRACKPSGLENCSGCDKTVSLLPRGDIPQAWTEASVRVGSHQGPIQTLYYCFACAQICSIPDEGAVVARERPKNELAFPGLF